MKVSKQNDEKKRVEIKEKNWQAIEALQPSPRLVEAFPQNLTMQIYLRRFSGAKIGSDLRT